MSEEEMRRKMEFIINQQAQFAADIQTLNESHGRLTGAITTIVGMIGKLAEAQERTVAQVAELAQAQTRTEIRFGELAAAQAETDERLNIFINVVERYINAQRNRREREADEEER